MDDIVPENQRHTEPALLDDKVLQFIPHHRRFNQHAAAKKRTDLAITQLFAVFFKRIILHIQLPELADLFCQRHAR